MIAALLLALLVVTEVQGVGCPPGEEEKKRSELLCENCKCNNVKGRKQGVKVTSREECEQKAEAAGQSYYNYLVDGPSVKICVFSDDTVDAAKSTSNEASCKTSREWIGGVPARNPDTGYRSLEQDRTDKITRSHWKVFEIKSDCVGEQCNLAIAMDGAAGYKCEGLKHIQFRPNPNTEDTKEACGAAAHAAGYDYFSYRTDKKYCYYGDHESSPHRCEQANRYATKSDQWAIYTVGCQS